MRNVPAPKAQCKMAKVGVAHKM